MSHSYDDANHLTLISNRQSDEDVISSFAYVVDKTGSRTKLVLANGDSVDYLHDDTYQLTREHRKDSEWEKGSRWLFPLRRGRPRKDRK